MDTLAKTPARTTPHRGGRPAKPDTERVGRNLTVWVTPGEYDRIRAGYQVQTTGSRITLSRYLRDRLLRDRPATLADDTKILRDYYVALEEVAHLLTAISARVHQADTHRESSTDRVNVPPVVDKAGEGIAGLPALMQQISMSLVGLSDHLYGTNAATSPAMTAGTPSVTAHK